MKSLGIITARGGSKGIPGKNIKPLAGMPLILYTLEAAKQSALTDWVVSTDDDEIAQICIKHGAQVLKRPSELAQDQTPTLPVIQQVLSQYEKPVDCVMILQPTSPFRTYHHINDALTLFKQNSDADSLVSVVQVPHNMTPTSLMTLTGNFLEPYTSEQILRRQDKPIVYARNGAAIYISKINLLKTTILGGKILAYKMSKLESIDIDDEEDWILAEKVMSS